MTKSDEKTERYELLSVIGRGAMATVWRARDHHAELDVALKVLHEHLADDQGLVEAFEREASLMQSVDHPGVARVQGLTEIDGRPAIAMDLYPGDDLARRLALEGPMPQDRALHIMIPALEALGAVHNKGILHRDIKPGNILFDRDDNPRLIDFGIGHAEELLTQGEAGHLGTIAYLAPERIDGWAVDARSDIYSAGATLFELLIGHPPYRADSAAEVLRMHREGPVADPRTFDKSISKRVADATKRALAPHPEDRFDSVDDFIAALNGEHEAPPELDEHRLWKAVSDQYGGGSFRVAALHEEGHEWVVYLSPSHEASMRGDDGARRRRGVRSILHRFQDFAQIPPDAVLAEREDASPHKITGIARGLSRAGAEEMVRTLERDGITARIGRRRRTPRTELREKILGATRTLARIAFFVIAAAWALSFLAILIDAESAGFRPDAQALQVNIVLLGGLLTGLFAGTLGLPSTVGEWWREQHSRDYLLDFCDHRALSDGTSPVGLGEFSRLQELRSPRTRSSYDRAINAIAHLSDRDDIDAHQADELLDQVVELADRIIALEQRLAVTSAAELATRIKQLDRRLARETAIKSSQQLITEKQALRQQLTDHDADEQRVQALAQSMHRLAARLVRLATEDEPDLPTILSFESLESEPPQESPDEAEESLDHAEVAAQAESYTGRE